MKNKLLLTTAIASVAFAGSSFAETKIGGNLEQTFMAVSEDNNDAKTGRSLGAEHNISLSSTKDLDNGLTASFGTVLEDGTADTHYLTVGNDTVSVTVGRDTGNNISSTAIPHISDQAGTIIGKTSASYDNVETANAHDADHVSLDFKVAGGTFTARYAPDQTAGGGTSTATNGSLASSRQSDSGVKDDSGSMNEFVYSGNLGVDGVKIVAGIARQEGKDGNEDGKAERYDVSYNFGQFAVGIGMDKSETPEAAASQQELKTSKAGITFAANDNLSLGINYLETERKEAGVDQGNDEEIIMASIGYNFGGLGIEMTYAEVDNVNQSASTDAEVFQIRTIQKF